MKLSSIGDVVHTLPALSAVKRAVPDAQISWIVEKNTAEILRNNGQIEQLYEIDTRSIRKPGNLLRELNATKRRFSELRKTKFDLSIDFQGLLKSAAISKISKSSVRAGFDEHGLREKVARGLYHQTHSVDLKTNVILKNIELAEKSIRSLSGDGDFTLDRSSIEFPIEIETSHQEEAESIVEKTGGSFIILNPAGGWPTKLWPAENYGILADEIFEETGIQSIVSVGPGEEILGQRVANASKKGVVAVESPTLKGFVALSKLAKGYVGGDTAPTHLAVSAKCPVVGIFGPTEWWRNGSLDEEDICVERTDIDCRIDCHRRSCNNWICMDIDVSRVRLAIKQRLRL